MPVEPIGRDALISLKVDLDHLDRLPPSLKLVEQTVRSVATAFAVNVTLNYRTHGTTTYLDFKRHRPSGPIFLMNVKMEDDHYRCYFQVTADRFDKVFDRASTLAWFFIIGRTSP
jgi:hypothetical protein